MRSRRVSGLSLIRGGKGSAFLRNAADAKAALGLID